MDFEFNRPGVECPNYWSADSDIALSYGSFLYGEPSFELFSDVTTSGEVLS
jgi:hypothetical protein